MNSGQKATGHLLRSFADFEADPAVIYEKRLNCAYTSNGWDRDALIFLRGGTRSVLSAKDKRLVLSDRQAVWMPKGTPYELTDETAIHESLWFLISDRIRGEAIQDNRLGPGDLLGLQNLQAVHLSSWMLAIRERYIFEKIVNLNPPELCTHYLEKQLVNGMLQIAFKTPKAFSGDTAQNELDPAVERTLRFIEQNIFEAIKLKDIAAYAHQPVRSLSRNFLHAVGEAPMAFLRRRRLDECRRLLETGEYQVTDLATLSGYSDSAAFSRAFTQQFGAPPSSVSKR